ncbi:hypothetical protein EHS25_010164 [Saitozyma podzolica]|uniref:Linalool dehydratase/isomerase domain-containing protein n=1 Tax=Saitozyma podzolica TaxID=1890683 RepID=A0A427YIS5_9TREE|nr:hypothetical protein EHS25_010164 [Saitozyma podzolica]
MKVPQLSLALGALVVLPALGNARPSPSPTLGRRWAAPSPALSLSKYDQEVFDVAMTINDWAWEPSTGWIESDDDNGHTSSRFTAWYVPGLLYRNGEGDVDKAIWAIKNLIGLQFTNPADNGTAWYWDYKEASDIPSPNADTYPAEIYGSYDPNWSYFIGLQFVQIIEEFESLLPSSLIDAMVDSTYKAARNLMTRVGYDGDNLVTAYSNPTIGRAIVVEWVGNRIGDTNLTMAGEQYAKDIYDLFTADGYNTLGEYNVPTYYGEDVLGLCQWIRHAPANSSLPTYGKYILTKLWEDIAEHYNYDLKNMVGPYDRVYHRNMLIDDNIISIFFWMLLGRDVSPVAPIGTDSAIYDLRQGASFALVGQTLRDTLNQTILDSLVTPVGDVDRLFTRGIRVSLDNDTTRVNTAWVNENVMAGGQQVAELYNRGSQFTPMILHWKSGNTTMPSRPYVSFFQLYATASTINATVTPWHIEVSYPNTTQAGTDVFEYLIGDIPAPYWAAGQTNLPCLDVSISSEGLNGTVELGKYGDFTIQSNNLWMVSYYVNTTYEGTPRMSFEVKYTC